MSGNLKPRNLDQPLILSSRYVTPVAPITDATVSGAPNLANTAVV